MVIRVLLFAFLCAVSSTEIITTTLDSAGEKTAAVVEQEDFIKAIMRDALASQDKYASVMTEKSMEVPPELLQFLLALDNVEITDFPTASFADHFPFDEFATFVTNFPWYSSYLTENGLTSFKQPSDFSTIVITQGKDDYTSLSTDSFTPAASSTFPIVPHKTTANQKISETTAVTGISSTNITPNSSSSFLFFFFFFFFFYPILCYYYYHHSFENTK
ncbi:unnamed protein product [Pichia kudriavzevii]